MSSLRYIAAAQLAAALEAADASLAGRVQVLQQPPDRVNAYPQLVVMPERFVIEPWQDDEVLDDDGEPIMTDTTTALMRVGDYEGSFRLWLATQHPAQREELEEAVTRAFFGDEMAPGRLMTSLPNVSVAGVPTGYNAPIANLVMNAEWREEMVFSERRWAWLTVETAIPIFALRANAAKVQSLIAALSQDVTTDISGAADEAAVIALLPDLEQYAIDETGAISAPP